MRLGVNIDHVATLRQARGTCYPDPLLAAMQVQLAGADGLTLHLREDRRHIQDDDVYRIKKAITIPMNLECAITEEMLAIAVKVSPAHCCLVPERREEVTTEGGLNVIGQRDAVAGACAILAKANIQASLFIDPEEAQIQAAVDVGAPCIEIHTGRYADAVDDKAVQQELEIIQHAVRFALNLGLQVNAGHGLHYENVQPIAQIPNISELNIGHSIVARAVFSGMPEAVKTMKELIQPQDS